MPAKAVLKKPPLPRLLRDYPDPGTRLPDLRQSPPAQGPNVKSWLQIAQTDPASATVCPAICGTIADTPMKPDLPPSSPSWVTQCRRPVQQSANPGFPPDCDHHH